jgi:N-acetylglutamate synthase-like GNAT family acetyltransferase
MRGVRISYLIEHPEYVPQLAQWLFEQWDFILGEKNPEARIEELREQMNRDELPIAWVAHGNGQLFGTAALRVDGPEGCEDLTPWLSRAIVSPHFRRRGIGTALCAHVEDEARSREIQTLYLFTLDKQAWFSRMGWTILAPCLWHERAGDIMCKQL